MLQFQENADRELSSRVTGENGVNSVRINDLILRRARTPAEVESAARGSEKLSLSMYNTNKARKILYGPAERNMVDLCDETANSKLSGRYFDNPSKNKAYHQFFKQYNNNSLPDTTKSNFGDVISGSVHNALCMSDISRRDPSEHRGSSAVGAILYALDGVQTLHRILYNCTIGEKTMTASEYDQVTQIMTTLRDRITNMDFMIAQEANKITHRSKLKKAMSSESDDMFTGRYLEAKVGCSLVLSYLLVLLSADIAPLHAASKIELDNAEKTRLAKMRGSISDMYGGDVDKCFASLRESIWRPSHDRVHHSSPHRLDGQRHTLEDNAELLNELITTVIQHLPQSEDTGGQPTGRPQGITGMDRTRLANKQA